MILGKMGSGSDDDDDRMVVKKQSNTRVYVFKFLFILSENAHEPKC